MAITGAIVTIDAMGCQRDVAQKVINKKADYVLALKGNQSALQNDIELFAIEQKSRWFADAEISQDTRIDGGHGPIEAGQQPSSTMSNGFMNAIKGTASKRRHRREPPRHQRQNRAGKIR